VFAQAVQDLALVERCRGRGVHVLRHVGRCTGCGAAGEPYELLVLVADAEHDAVAEHVDEGSALAVLRQAGVDQLIIRRSTHGPQLLSEAVPARKCVTDRDAIGLAEVAAEPSGHVVGGTAAGVLLGVERGRGLVELHDPGDAGDGCHGLLWRGRSELVVVGVRRGRVGEQQVLRLGRDHDHRLLVRAGRSVVVVKVVDAPGEHDGDVVDVDVVVPLRVDQVQTGCCGRDDLGRVHPVASGRVDRGDQCRPFGVGENTVCHASGQLIDQLVSPVRADLRRGGLPCGGRGGESVGQAPPQRCCGVLVGKRAACNRFGEQLGDVHSGALGKAQPTGQYRPPRVGQDLRLGHVRRPTLRRLLRAGHLSSSTMKRQLPLPSLRIGQ